MKHLSLFLFLYHYVSPMSNKIEILLNPPSVANVSIEMSKTKQQCIKMSHEAGEYYVTVLTPFSWFH